jgi:hypothetical protein
MAQERLSMRKVRELLRLKFDQRLSNRKIAAALSMSRSAVGECLHRAATAAVTWPLPDWLDDAQLERRLYPVKAKAVEIPWHERTHQGKMCCGRTPMATFEDGKRICREKAIA